MPNKAISIAHPEYITYLRWRSMHRISILPFGKNNGVILAFVEVLQARFRLCLSPLYTQLHTPVCQTDACGYYFHPISEGERALLS